MLSSAAIAAATRESLQRSGETAAAKLALAGAKACSAAPTSALISSNLTALR